MSVTITSPTSASSLFVQEEFTLAGTATGDVANVLLSADGAPNLATVAVFGGQWSFTRAFSRPGVRTITAQGLKSDGSAAGAAASVTVLMDTARETCDLAQPQVKIVNENHPKKGATIYRLPGHSSYFFRAAMMIDADGAYRAYHPNNTGLDHNDNGRNADGSWFAVVCSDAAHRHPVVQGAGDPAPGYYVSTTSLEDASITDKRNPRRYVDSESIPYFVLPGTTSVAGLGAKLGDFGAVYNPKTGKLCYAIYADIGPRKKIGEGSIALAKALGVPSSPRTGGMEERRLLYVVFPGSRAAHGQAWTHAETSAEIAEAAAPHLLKWGGIDRLKSCYAHLPA
jgi:hypothetical protein